MICIHQYEASHFCFFISVEGSIPIHEKIFISARSVPIVKSLTFQNVHPLFNVSQMFESMLTLEARAIKVLK